MTVLFKTSSSHFRKIIADLPNIVQVCDEVASRNKIQAIEKPSWTFSGLRYRVQIELILN